MNNSNVIKIYGFNTQNNLKPLLTAEEVGINYVYIPLRPSKGEHKLPEHIKRHPLGKIPALEHNGEFLFESNAMSRYLASLKAGSFYPIDLWQRARIEQWIDFVTLHVGRWINSYYYEEVVKPIFLKQPSNPDAFFEPGHFLEMSLPVLDKKLGTTRYLNGQEFTLADLIAYSYFQISENSSFRFSKFGNIVNWYNGLKSRESFQKAHLIANKAEF